MLLLLSSEPSTHGEEDILTLGAGRWRWSGTGTCPGPQVSSSVCRRGDHQQAALSHLPQYLPKRSVVLPRGCDASTSYNSLVLMVEAEEGERTGQGLEK